MKLENNPYHAPTELATGGYVHMTTNAMTVTYDTVHYAISTSPLNGGLHHIMALRNQQLTYHIETEADLPGGSTAKYLAMEFEQLDLPIHFCSALLTSATMERHAYVKEEVDHIIIEAIATVGVEQTAHRAGNGAFYDERDGAFHPVGTINLFLFTNKALSDGALTKSLITITEAKTAALEEANVNSVHDDSLATGTATDGVIFTINPDGEVITDSGTFSLFGDTLAKAVRHVMAKALENYHNG